MTVSNNCISYLNMLNFALSKCGKIRLVLEPNDTYDAIRVCIYQNTNRIDAYGPAFNEYRIFKQFDTWLGRTGTNSNKSWPEWAYNNKRPYMSGFNICKFRHVLPCLRIARSCSELKLVMAAHGIDL